ncbi:MAG: Integrase catalytic domain-containing protein [Clostridium sp.]|jgi:putative transposase
MLDRAISALPQDAHPIIHSDRGCHYRWPGWIDRTRKAGLIRSMSQKGCSPDNSACEGFFGRMKNEMFYGRSWQGITVEDFMQQIEAYMVWYRDMRIKISLGGWSPAKYRIKMGLAI